MSVSSWTRPTFRCAAIPLSERQSISRSVFAVMGPKRCWTTVLPQRKTGSSGRSCLADCASGESPTFSCLSPMVWSDFKAPLSETTLRPSFSVVGFTLSAIFMAMFARQTAVMSLVSLKRFARPRISPRPVKSSTTSSSTGRSVISGLSSWLS